MIMVNCLNCDKEIRTYPSRIKRGDSKFCSKQCFNISENLKVALKKAQLKRWAGHKLKKTKRVCIVCGKEFEVDTSTLKYRPCLCCSIKCSGEHRSKTHRGSEHHNWTGGRVERTCKVCKKIFYVKKSQIKWSGAKFCSFKCRSLYGIKHHSHKYGTDIEIIMKEALLNTNIKFAYQKRIETITRVDFLVLPKLVVQCDGDYWHNLPKQIIKDIQIDKDLTIEGYKILRFWGSEIKADIASCIEKIINEMDIESDI